jgi:hypothetical protein
LEFEKSLADRKFEKTFKKALLSPSMSFWTTDPPNGIPRAHPFESDVRMVASKQQSSASQGRDGEVMIKTLQQAKRFLKVLVGFTLLAIGIIMIATPGPGVLTILLALGVLAAEFVWARRLLDRLKEQGVRLRETVFHTADRA